MMQLLCLSAFLAFTLGVCHGGKQAIPDDVKALMSKRKRTQRWHHYQAIPSLNINQNAIQSTGSVDPSTTNCTKVIAHFEKKYGIPQHLMQAIARVESRCRPWAVHHNGSSHQFRQVKTALAFLETATGNVQVGCMQLDVSSHGKRFKTTEMMMTPYYNIEFAAKLLRRLYKRYGSWEKAVSFYHAASPAAQKTYCRKIASQLAHLRGSKTSKSGGDSWI